MDQSTLRLICVGVAVLFAVVLFMRRKRKAE